MQCICRWMHAHVYVYVYVYVHVYVNVCMRAYIRTYAYANMKALAIGTRAFEVGFSGKET